jgi:hypothetical protein
MFGLSTEAANSAANWTYLVAGGLAVFFTATTVAASWVMWRTSSDISDAKDRELVRFQTEAKERTASLENSSEKIRLEAIVLQKRLEEERVSRLKLQAALASRHLSPEDSDRLSDAVRGKVAQVVLQFTSDAESLAFTQDIANALTRGGVHVIPQGSGIMSPKPYGVIVSSVDPSPLTQGLRAAHVDIRISPAQGAVASILVGEKPPAL